MLSNKKNKAVRWRLLALRHRFLYTGLFHLRLARRCFDLTHFQHLHQIAVCQLSGSFLESRSPTLGIVQFARQPFLGFSPLLLLDLQPDDALSERLLAINAGGGDDAGSRALVGNRSTLEGSSGSVSGTPGCLHVNACGGNVCAHEALA